MLVAFGAPMLDIIIKVDETIFTKYNLEPNNTVRFENHHQPLLELLKSSQKTIKIGGSITNTLHMFKRLSKHRQVSYFGAIGDDELGDVIKDKMVEENIKTHFQVVENGETAKCLVLVNGDCRSLITNLGASKNFTTDFERGYLRNGEMFYVSGLFIDTSFKSINIAYNIFIDENKPICLNLGATFVVQKYPLEITYMFDNADLIFGNEDEFAALANIFNVISENLKDLLQKITLKFPKKQNKIFVLTRGEKPLYLHQNGEVFKFDVPKLNESEIKDTNGAGDAFVGGFLHKYLQKEPIEECVRCAIWCSSQIIQKTGFDIDDNLKYID